VAELLEHAETVADIGTDHALLPIYLIENNMAKKVIACDIAKGPLEVAEKNVIKKGVADKVLLRLANGLDKVDENECNAVTIAGMGGETIAEILNNAPWLKTKKPVLILQPMTSDDKLREYLVENGFQILKEKCTFSKGRVYTVMKAVYTGKNISYKEDYFYTGEILSEPKTVGKAEIAFVKKHLLSMRKCVRDIEGVERRKELSRRLTAAIPLIEQKLEKFSKIL
jgi:tRNA (adenine22-N1)-methyltransferase